MPAAPENREMKLEDFLMRRREEQRRRCELEEEVAELEGVLRREERLGRILRCALHHGPLLFRSCFFSSRLPLQIQVLLAELAMVEEEIIHLEKKVDGLKLCLHEEKEQTDALSRLRRRDRWGRQRRRGSFCRLAGPAAAAAELAERHPPATETKPRGRRRLRGRNASLGSISPETSDVRLQNNLQSGDAETPQCDTAGKPARSAIAGAEARLIGTPNELSEELVGCLIGVFHRLNRTEVAAPRAAAGHDSPAATIKFSLSSCMSSKGFASRPSFNCKTPAYSSEEDDGGGVDGESGGPYQNFVSVTESSLDMSRIHHCLPSIRRLRVLIRALCWVDLSPLTYKQKLAFWINIYNACIMNAFLQHGLPPSSDKVLALLNRAAMNVGGIILNALAIEHFILRHPSSSIKIGIEDEKEALLRDTFGLSYPEPDVTFALCRGTWSSPALRIYRGEEVMNELERAKIEYLESSVQMTAAAAGGKMKRISLPKLLWWHMRDFAGDDSTESLVEWIYSQLPRSGSSALKKQMIMDCLRAAAATVDPAKLHHHHLPPAAVADLVDVRPYHATFRYLLPPFHHFNFSPTD